MSVSSVVCCAGNEKRCNQARVRCILENGAEIYDVDYIFLALQGCFACHLDFFSSVLGT